VTRSRATATKVAEAADALLDWLQTQSMPAGSPPNPRDPVAPAASAVVPELPTEVRSAGDLKAEGDARGNEGPGAVPAAPVQDSPEPGDRPDPREATRVATLPARGHVGPRCAAPLRLAHTDWLYHRLTIAGPQGEVAAFRAAARGAGVIPWHLDLDRLEEDCFHLLVSPPAPQRRTLSVTGARIVAGQLRDAVGRRHDLAVARVGRSRACPLDLHALVPVPDALLRLGPDDPASLAWLWEHWGTTQALRHVAEATAVSGAGRDRLLPGDAAFAINFWSADWTPWRALARIAARWPALRFDSRPVYDTP
jgi:hypothetical protein